MEGWRWWGLLNIFNTPILHFPSLFLSAQTTIGQKKIINASPAHHSPPLSLLSLLSPISLSVSPPGTRGPIRTNDEGPGRFCKKEQAGVRAPVLLCATHDQ